MVLPKLRNFPRLFAVATALNGFAFLAVNYWIYMARWWFIEAKGDTLDAPPTISRAISLEVIGELFAFWITLSGVCLFFGVLLVMTNYMRMRRVLSSPKLGTRIALGAAPIALIFLQGLASYGMHMLSIYRFPFANELHMVGSYLFFACQAVAILLYAVMNHLLLRDPLALSELEAAGNLRGSWVRRRRVAGALAVLGTLIYYGFFQAKGIFPYEEYPWVYVAYVSLEPALISYFLVVLALAHVDKFQRPTSVKSP